MIPAKVAPHNKGQQCGRVRVRIIHGLTLVIKNSYTYCKSLLALEAKYYYAFPQRDRLVGKDHRLSPTTTHKEDNQKRTSCNKFVTQLLPYVHASGLANFNKSISQFNNYSTSTPLILPPLYLKTTIKYQTSLSIQCTLKFLSWMPIILGVILYPKQITMLF